MCGVFICMECSPRAGGIVMYVGCVWPCAWHVHCVVCSSACGVHRVYGKFTGCVRCSSCVWGVCCGGHDVFTRCVACSGVWQVHRLCGMFTV